jgi:phospholipid/cholesterol/gamma-HCH transport system substrate-binding protein
MDLHYKQELQVGALVLVALAIVVAGVVWMTGRSLGRDRHAVQVRFNTVAGLTAGDPVMISGVQVGRVANVELEDVGRVLVTVEVLERVRPRSDASAQVRSLDFLGAKFVAYTPGRAEAFLPSDSVIDGAGEADLASNAGDLAGDAAAFLERSQALLSVEMLDQVRKTMGAAERALSVMARLGSGPMINEVERTLSSVQRAATRLDSTLANPAIDESLNQLDELTANVNEMASGLALATNSLAAILAKMDTTGGTLGRLVSDTTIHHDLHSVLTEMRLLLEDIRLHPGRYAPGAIKIF